MERDWRLEVAIALVWGAIWAGLFELNMGDGALYAYIPVLLLLQVAFGYLVPRWWAVVLPFLLVPILARIAYSGCQACGDDLGIVTELTVWLWAVPSAALMLVGLALQRRQASQAGT